MKVLFRPHHFLCTLGFSGKGYSQEFVRNYIRIVEFLESNENLEIEVVSGVEDSVCKPCPNNLGHQCKTEEKIKSLDIRHQEALEIKVGEKLSWLEAREKIRKKISLERFHQICKGCSWKPFGICESALKQLREKKDG